MIDSPIEHSNTKFEVVGLLNILSNLNIHIRRKKKSICHLHVLGDHYAYS